MQALLFDPDRPLPEVLGEDIQQLLRAEGDGAVTWAQRDTRGEPGHRRFTLRKTEGERRTTLRLEFWIPEALNERGLAAILPAHLAVAEFRHGRSAAVELGSREPAAWRDAVAGLARTCARLMNELWGRTDAIDVATVEP